MQSSYSMCGRSLPPRRGPARAGPCSSFDVSTIRSARAGPAAFTSSRAPAVSPAAEASMSGVALAVCRTAGSGASASRASGLVARRTAAIPQPGHGRRLPSPAGPSVLDSVLSARDRQAVTINGEGNPLVAETMVVSEERLVSSFRIRTDGSSISTRRSLAVAPENTRTCAPVVGSIRCCSGF